MTQEKGSFVATLCFPCRGSKVLLGWKMKRIGQGCWNGYGGGIEIHETAQEAAVRKLREESGLRARPKDLEQVALVDFHTTRTDGSIFICRVHVYRLERWTSTLKATDEMANPTWFHISTLPFDEMMPADRFWVPQALGGKKIIVSASYGPLQKTLLGEVSIQPAQGW
jgi:ADP-ribose pyrophosphatase YjhB (NUDIX family)